MVIEGTHYSPKCFCKNCKKIKIMDKKASLQKESEWEKTKKEFLKELKQALQNNIPHAVNTEFSKFLPAVETAIDTIVSEREKEIAEEVKKKINSAGGLGGWKHLDDILNEIILKH